MNKIWPFFLAWNHAGISTLYTLSIQHNITTESQAANERILFS